MSKIVALLLVLMALLLPVSRVYAQALGPDDTNSIYGDTEWYAPAGATSQSCSDTTLSGSDPPEQIWNYFKAKGLSDQQVAGIMGNIEAESAFNPEALEIGGNSTNPYDALGQGWGLVQWTGDNQTTPGDRTTGDKVTAIYKETGVSGNVYELATELAMIWGEMTGTSPDGIKNMVAGLQQINDAAQAATYFNANFEHGLDSGNVRESNAVKILAKYGGSASTGGGGPSCGARSSIGACKILYQGQYSQQQLAQIFGNPGTADSHPALRLTNTSFMNFSVQISPLIEPCLKSVEQQIQSANINYKITAVGCYRFDSNNGSSNIGLSSYHTYGAACDINPYTNNFYDTGSVPYDPNCPASSGAVDSGHCYDMPQSIIDIFAKNGFTWGGSWDHPKDYMHFEWHGVLP